MPQTYHLQTHLDMAKQIRKLAMVVAIVVHAAICKAPEVEVMAYGGRGPYGAGGQEWNNQHSN